MTIDFHHCCLQWRLSNGDSCKTVLVMETLACKIVLLPKYCTHSVTLTMLLSYCVSMPGEVVGSGSKEVGRCAQEGIAVVQLSIDQISISSDISPVNFCAKEKRCFGLVSLFRETVGCSWIQFDTVAASISVRACWRLTGCRTASAVDTHKRIASYCILLYRNVSHCSTMAM